MMMSVIEALTRSECTFNITWDEEKGLLTCTVFSKDKTKILSITNNSWQEIEENIQRRLMVAGADYWARITSKTEGEDLVIQFP